MRNIKIEEYNREKARKYSEKWAYGRNPSYYNFDTVGGDCTSFISQCLFDANKTMNYGENGWYYHNGNDKSPSWSGVEFMYQFLIYNTGVGPFGKKVDKEEIEIGDIAQLSFDGKTFGHSLLIVEKTQKELEHILVATHTFDSYGRRIASYSFEEIRFIHIKGIRKW